MILTRAGRRADGSQLAAQFGNRGLHLGNILPVLFRPSVLQEFLVVVDGDLRLSIFPSQQAQVQIRLSQLRIILHFLLEVAARAALPCPR